MTEPVWLNETALILLHAETLAEHGGPEGLRDAGLLQSALARPPNLRAPNLRAYEQVDDLPRLAAAYGIGTAGNHPFVDGNKRAAFLAIGLFLAVNGFRLVADKVDATRIMLGVAGGTLTESELASWIGSHAEPMD